MRVPAKALVRIQCPLFLVFIITSFSCFLIPGQLMAQMLKVGDEVHLVVNGCLNVKNANLINNGTIENTSNGAISLTGNWQNNSSYLSLPGTEVILTGNEAQEIGGTVSTTFYNLRLDNGAGFLLGNNVYVHGVLEFDAGILNTGDFLVTIGSTGSISNTSTTSFVEGKLANTYDEQGSKPFPIGKDGKYRPLSLQYITLAGTSVVTAEQFETGLSGTMPPGTMLLTTDRHWVINQTGGTDFEYYVTLDATDYLPSGSVFFLKKDNGVIESFEASEPNYTNLIPFTSFSEFGLGQICDNPFEFTVIPTNPTCYGASNGMIKVTVIPQGSYYFSNDGGISFAPEPKQSPYTFINLIAGHEYIIQVKDLNGHVYVNCSND